MFVQNVNLVNNSQPLRQVAAVPLRNNSHDNSTPLKNIQAFSANDSMETSETEMLQKKYDFACQLAAFYKTKYDELSKNGSCNA